MLSNTSKQLIIIGKKLSKVSGARLIKLAQSTNFDLENAKKQSPQYWSRLGLSRHKDEIKETLGTQAEPNTDEFFRAVYNYQKANPNIELKDGILGDDTFGYMAKANPKLFGTPSGPQDQDVDLFSTRLNKQELEQKIKELGLVSLEGVVPVKNNPYAHPRFRELFEHLTQIKAPINRLTEAFPPTVRHMSKEHYNGNAIDFTLSSTEHAQPLVDYINKSLPGFRAINEYAKTFETTTGGHIHVSYLGQSIDRVSNSLAHARDGIKSIQQFGKIRTDDEISEEVRKTLRRADQRFKVLKIAHKENMFNFIDVEAETILQYYKKVLAKIESWENSNQRLKKYASSDLNIWDRQARGVYNLNKELDEEFNQTWKELMATKKAPMSIEKKKKLLEDIENLENKIKAKLEIIVSEAERLYNHSISFTTEQYGERFEMIDKMEIFKSLNMKNLLFGWIVDR